VAVGVAGVRRRSERLWTMRRWMGSGDGFGHRSQRLLRTAGSRRNVVAADW
jgi:hypothetical protein